MDLTKLQISELMRKHAAKRNGLHDLMEIMIESMMVAERTYSGAYPFAFNDDFLVGKRG